MPSTKLNQFELNMMNAIFNLGGAGGLINGFWGSISSACGNAMGVCIELIEAQQATGVKPNKWTVAQKFKMFGPLLGLTENEYVNLAVACGLVGLSTAGLAAAVAVGGPAGVFLAALGLFGDAIGLGAAQHGLENRINDGLGNKAAMIGNARRIELYLDAEYKKEMARRPSIGRPVYR